MNVDYWNVSAGESETCRDCPSQSPSLGNARRFSRSSFGTRRATLEGLAFSEGRPAPRSPSIAA